MFKIIKKREMPGAASFAVRMAEWCRRLYL